MIVSGPWPAIMLAASSVLLAGSILTADPLALALALPMMAISIRGLRGRSTSNWGRVWAIASITSVALMPLMLYPEPLRVLAAIWGAFIVGHMAIVGLKDDRLDMHRAIHTATAFMSSNIVLVLWAIMALVLSVLFSTPPMDNHELMMGLGTMFIGLGLMNFVSDPFVHRLMEDDDANL